MKFSKGTKIMLDRDWSNIENVEFEIVKIYPLKNEVMVRITDNGLKVLKNQVRDFIYNFVVDDLRKLLHFGQDEDLEPHAYKQVIDAFIEKYETKDVFIFYDKEIVENNPDLDKPLWCFVDVRNGHTEWFETQIEALEYLKVYKEEEEYLDNNQDQVRLYE